ncbi:MAG: hypothetical protein J6A21_09710 [Lentisphaeria bacterium]|nr:hypothetical protein [Lentisphaeria bacterium]
MKVDNYLPGGNIRVLELQDREVLLEEEARDCREGWFYWKFRALFEEEGLWKFRFSRCWKVGTRGPAVSTDRGKSWHWLSGEKCHESSQEFLYECRTPGEVWFSQAMPYMQENWERFANVYSENPFFHPSVLCRSRKGRNAELLEIREGNPRRAVLLTARHHCEEMSASMVMEGIGRFALSSSEDGKRFRQNFALFLVPFTDKDGVEEGDQGKGRIPRDHGRDYEGEHLYPETAAIRQRIERVRPFLVLDLHSPWLRSGRWNEEPYFVEDREKRFKPELERFCALLEQEAPECAPFSRENILRWGTEWNTPENYSAKGDSGAGKCLRQLCGAYPFVKLGASLEVPFANFGEKTVTEKEFLLFGNAVGKTILKYGEDHVL